MNLNGPLSCLTTHHLHPLCKLIFRPQIDVEPARDGNNIQEPVTIMSKFYSVTSTHPTHTDAASQAVSQWEHGDGGWSGWCVS